MKASVMLLRCSWLAASKSTGKYMMIPTCCNGSNSATKGAQQLNQTSTVISSRKRAALCFYCTSSAQEFVFNISSPPPHAHMHTPFFSSSLHTQLCTVSARVEPACICRCCALVAQAGLNLLVELADHRCSMGEAAGMLWDSINASNW